MAQTMPPPDFRISRASRPTSVTSKHSEMTAAPSSIPEDLYVDNDLLASIANVDLKGSVSLKSVNGGLVASLKKNSAKLKNYSSAADAFAEGTRHNRDSRARLVSMVKIPVKMEPTYRTEPAENKSFSVSKTESVVRDILEDYLADKAYDPSKFSTVTCSLVTAIKNAMKDLNFPRYKIVCQVTLSENRSQGLRSASRGVWNTETDSVAVVNYSNQHINVVASVFGVYLD